jgi:hypothetical protein
MALWFLALWFLALIRSIQEAPLTAVSDLQRALEPHSSQAVFLSVQMSEAAMRILFVTLVMTTAFTSQCLAAYFIVRDSPAQPCRIVAERPTDTKLVIVGNKDGYKEQTQAVSELAAICK